MEILLIITLFIAVLSLAGVAVFIAFILPGMLWRAGYPITVPGWQTSLNQEPPFDATLADMGSALSSFVLLAADVKGYDKTALTDKLNNLKILWVPSESKDKRFIIDKFGRSIAGDHTGDLIRVVYLESDKIGNTAFFHELGHEAHELEDKIDMAHEDKDMWNNIVMPLRGNFS